MKRADTVTAMLRVTAWYMGILVHKTSKWSGIH
jgi:hypothetical protein